MFIQTEDTPNPNALKFILDSQVSPDKQIHFASLQEVKTKSKLAIRLFDVDNVKSVFFGNDFITITKHENADWLIMKPEILMVIMDHISSGQNLLEEDNHDQDFPLAIEYSEIEKQIIEIINSRVRPSVAMDGGDIIYRGFQDGIVKLELRGACSGCPRSMITLKNGIESMLKHFIPEVESVEAVL